MLKYSKSIYHLLCIHYDKAIALYWQITKGHHNSLAAVAERKSVSNWLNHGLLNWFSVLFFQPRPHLCYIILLETKSCAKRIGQKKKLCGHVFGTS